MENKDNLKELLLTNRPKLSAGSLSTYQSILKNLFYKAHPKSEPMNMKWFENQDDVLKHLENLPSKKRKTILSALVVVTDKTKNNDLYKALMESDGKQSHLEDIQQSKTEKQQENWITQDEIKELFNKMYKNVKPLFKKKSFDEFSNAEYQQFQNLIILSVLGGLFISPRRSQDYTEMKIRGNIDKENDNYKTKSSFIFSKYKTARFYGKQELEIPKDLGSLLNKFIKINPYDYLFNDSNGNKLNSVKLSQRLNNIFGGKHISVNILRHSFLSDKYKDIPNLTDMLQTAENMGHSINEALEYIKH
jgi:integrase